MKETPNPLLDDPHYEYSLIVVRSVNGWFSQACVIYREDRPLVVVHPADQLLSKEEFTKSK